jgi:hypothetical protein
VSGRYIGRRHCREIGRCQVTFGALVLPDRDDLEKHEEDENMPRAEQGERDRPAVATSAT